MSGFRIASGGLIDRSTNLNFKFDGKSFNGYQGDTLASALIASCLLYTSDAADE